MGWRVRWWVHIWTGGTGLGSVADDREGIRAVHVDSVAALRDLITKLRADPRVRRYRYGPYDELDTSGQPTQCTCGRELHGSRSWAAEFDWKPCADCPGHGVYHCRKCATVTVWPPPGPACAPSAVDRCRRPPPYPGGDGRRAGQRRAGRPA